MLMRPEPNRTSKATDLTQSLSALEHVAAHVAVFTSQILTVPSPNADATGAESGEKATDLTQAVMLERVYTGSRLHIPNLPAVSSADAVRD